MAHRWIVPAQTANSQSRDDTGKGDEAADGKVDAGGDDDHGHPDGDDGYYGDLLHDVEQVVFLQEVRPTISLRLIDLCFAQAGVRLGELGQVGIAEVSHMFVGGDSGKFVSCCSVFDQCFSRVGRLTNDGLNHV